MEHKHTPGPWDWFTGMDSNSALIKSSSPGMRFFVGANGQGFAHTVGLPGEEDVANANLIAAAPDLLDVARAAEAIFARQKWATDSNDPEAVALRKLRAVIARATGSPALYG